MSTSGLSASVNSGPLPDPSGLGPATLRVDRDAVPHLRRAFDGALSKLDEQIELAMTGVRVSPWAGDPVSETAASSFNNHAITDTDSALNALRTYQQRLKSASDALRVVAEQYDIVERTNTTSLRGAGGC